MKYAVGQKLWLEPAQWALVKTPQEITIDKVGRKWAEYVVHGTRYRVEIGKVDVDGAQYGSPGTLWLTKAACDEHNALKAEWTDFMRRLTIGVPPPGLTREGLAQIKKILGR